MLQDTVVYVVGQRRGFKTPGDSVIELTFPFLTRGWAAATNTHQRTQKSKQTPSFSTGDQNLPVPHEFAVEPE